MQLRPLTSNDYSAYIERVIELDMVHREVLPDVFRAADDGLVRTREYFEAQISDPDMLLLGAWVEGELGGYVHAMLRTIAHEWIRVGRCYVCIDNLAVGPRWQRRGLGQALVDAVADWARSRGATQLELDVWEVNVGALRFYEEIGFEPRRRSLARRL
jgi:GNAT superfamily N-acetyltransferase